jgi:hypothetical protein
MNKIPLDEREGRVPDRITARPGWQEEPETVGALLASRLAGEPAPPVPAGFADRVMVQVRAADPFPVGDSLSAAFVGVSIGFFTCAGLVAAELFLLAGAFLASYGLVALKAILMAWAMIKVTAGTLGSGPDLLFVGSIFLLAVGMCGGLSALFALRAGKENSFWATH